MKNLVISFFLLLCMATSAPCAELAELNQTKLAEMIKNNSDKVIMLNFFATWCPPCKVEIPELNKLRKTFPEKDFLLIGLSVDEDKNAVQPFLQNNNVDYPVYLAARDIIAAYGISSVPHNAFYAKGGKLVISEPGLADLEIMKKVVENIESR